MSFGAIHASASAAGDGCAVLDVCHRQMRFALGKLSALMTRLVRHGADAEAQALAEEIVAFFSTTVREHHEDEERHVFPRLLAGGDPQVVEAVVRLQQDHDWLEESWMDLSSHLAVVARGQPWYDVDRLREGAVAFAALLHDHVALEESCIYPQLRARLQPGERREMGREMARRRRARRRSAPAAARA